MPFDEPEITVSLLYSGEYDGKLTLKASEYAGFVFLHSGALTAFPVPALPCREGGYLCIPAGEDCVLTAHSARVTVVRFKLSSVSERSFTLPLSGFSAEAAEIFVKLAALSGSADDYALLHIKSLLARLIGLSGLQAEKEEKIYAGTELLKSRFLENLPVSDYAAACGISESAFRTAFTKLYALSPVDYRNRLRLAYAKSLISELSMPASAAAREAGFASASYFGKLYKKVYGTTPAEGEKENGQMG